MSDTALTEPQVWACNRCDRTFDTANALGGHLAAGHRPKEPCPECGKVVTSGVGLVRHLAIHNPPKKKRGRPFGSKNPPRTAVDVVPLPRPIAVDLLTVDEIVVGTAAMLYPDGQVPVRQLPALLAWRDATSTMLEEIR